MKPGWLRYLNPFYFEPRFLRWLFWVNLAIALLVVPLVGLLLTLAPKFFKAASKQAPSIEQLFEKLNAPQLRRSFLLEDHAYRQMLGLTGHLLISFALVLCAFIAMLLVNALYLYKAHHLLKASPKTDGGA